MPVFGSEALEFATGLDLSGMKGDLKRGLAAFNDAGSKYAKALAPIGKAVLAIGTAVVGLGAALGKSAVQVGADFEALETRLGTLLGSAEAGAVRMQEIFEFASTTPFELNELVEAEVNLRALGLEAEKVLPLVLDFAGAMGTELPSAAVEVGRAMQFGAGAVETIAGRALRAQVELRTGTDALSMSTEQFREELTKTLTDPEGIFAGGTQKLSQTFTGMISNLQDQWTGFQKAVADAGLFAGVKAALGVTLELINENKQGISEIADIASRVLVGAFKASITALGFLADSLTGAKFLSFEVARATLEIVNGFITASRAGLGLLAVLEKIPGVGPLVTDGLNEIQSTLDSLSSGLSIAGDEAAASFGDGAAAAVRYKDAIDSAVEAARALGTATSDFAPKDRGDGPTPDFDGDGVVAEAADMWAELARLEDDALASRLSRFERYSATALDLWSDFATARIAGEETLGQTVRRIGLGFLAGQLLDLALTFALVAAAYFATGQFAIGALYALGAAVAVGGAAVLGAAATGRIFGGGSSGSAGESGASGSTSSGSAQPRSADEEADRVSGSSRNSSSARTSGDSRPIIIEMRYGHREFSAISADNLKLPGSPIGDALREGSVVGQRVA